MPELANMPWAFATAKHSDEELRASLARAVAQRVSKFHEQALANSAWAFVMAKLSYEELIAMRR